MAETTTVTPTEVAFALRLKRSRFLVLVGGESTLMLRRRLDRVSKYAITRLQRRYPSLAVSRPVWSVDAAPTGYGVPKRAFCYFGYIDLTGYTDQPCLVLLKDAYDDVAFPLNRAARRAS
jgi:hypothetical protein